MNGNESTNTTLLEEVRQLRYRVLELEQNESERERIQGILEACKQLATLTGEVIAALIQPTPLQECLQHCTQALVTHLKAAFARIWILNTETQILELVASAGLYTHLDGHHSRIAVGTLKIGRIAARRQPHLTNTVLGDPQIDDQAWAKREGMVSFAGYPLLVEGRVMGVMALFARIPLSSAVLDAMASIANAIALDIERKRIGEEQAHLAAATEIALQMRNDFLVRITHDLKIPLTVMTTEIQLLERRLKRTASVDPTWITERLAAIETSATKMHNMVENLLTVAGLQMGQKLDVNLLPLFLVPLAERVCREQQQTTKLHHLRLQASSQNILVRGDPIHLDRALTNLLANAIKYSPEKGTITIDIGYEEQPEQSWATIRVQDEGLGIPAADLPFIFEPFYRATNVRESIQGTGVGLASVAQVITEHGGTISAHSEEGRGSCFLIRLPALVWEPGSATKSKKA